MQKLIRLNRTRNTIRNVVFGGINKIATLGFPFILRTFLIKVLGIEFAGLDDLFISILQVLNLSELGLSSAVVYCLYKPIAHDDKDSICALLKLFRKVYFGIGSFILLIGSILVPFLDHFIKGNYPISINLYLIYYVYLINSCISYFFGGYKSVILAAHQRVDIINNIVTLVKCVMYFAQMIILLTYKNYYIYILMLPIFTLIVNLLTAYETNRIYPKYVPAGIVTDEVKADLREKVSGLMITKLCSITRNGFDSLFTSAFLGLTMAAIYSNYYFILKAITIFLGIIVQSIIAGVGNSIQTESIEHNYRDLKRFNFMYLWISGVCTACLFSSYQPFMRLWMGESYLLPISSVALFCAYFFLLTMGDMQSVYYTAAGLWWYYRKPTIIESILNLVLNFILGTIWGLNGIIAGTLISLFCVNFLYSERLVFRHYFKNGKEKEFYVNQFKYLITTVIVTLIVYVICDLFSVNNSNKSNIINLGIRILVSFCVSNLLFYLLYKKTGEFNSAKRWLKEKLNSRGATMM